METRTGESGLQTASEQQSNALAVALKALRRDRKGMVLDLGPASGTNVRFFSGYPCRLQIADIFDSLVRLDPGSRERNEELRVGDHLGLRPDEPLHLILAWDLFNYLTPEELQILIQSLLPWCRRGTRLMSLISSRPQMPVEPLQFTLLDEGHLRYGEASRIARPSPRYNEPGLAKLMPGFEVDSSLLLRNGMLEFLWVYQLDE